MIINNKSQKLSFGENSKIRAPSTTLFPETNKEVANFNNN